MARACNLNLRSVFLIVFLSASIIACTNSEEAQKKVTPTIPVYTVKTHDVPIYNQFVGQIYGLKDIPIRARVDGFLEQISFQEGSRVKSGQLLYEIDPAPFKAEVAAYESKVAEAQTIVVNAETELNRYKPLAKSNAVSQSDLDAAQAKYDASRANLRAAESNLEQAKIKLSYCSIQSPIDGIIGKTNARVGEYVGKDPNPVILNSVSRIDTVRVQFSISESKYLELAKASMNEHVKGNNKADRKDSANVSLILADGSTYPERGKVDFVDNQINAYTASLLIQASFPNSNKLLRPGLYAKARVKLKDEENALVIPQRCLSELQGSYSVFVVNDSNKIEIKTVEVYHRYGDMAIVRGEIKENDKVVIDAIQSARPGLQVKPEESNFESKLNSL